MLEVIKKVPIPTAGLSLGLVALGNLLAGYSAIAQGTCVLLSVLMASLVIAKVAAFPSMVAEDMKNPIFASVSATLFMALMQVAAYLAPVVALPAFGLWAFAVISHIVLMVWFGMKHLRSLKLEKVFPTYFICYVGIIVASVTSPAFGAELIGSALFWFGFACYPMLFVLVTARYIKHPVPEPARPLFCVYSAPASLSIAGYLAVSTEPSVAFVSVLLVFAQAFFVIVLTQLPKFVKGGFFPSFAAMTFPFVITATALGRGLDLLASSGYGWASSFQWLVGLETVFAVVMVAFVFAHYMVFLFRPARQPQTQTEPFLEVTSELAANN